MVIIAALVLFIHNSHQGSGSANARRTHENRIMAMVRLLVGEVCVLVALDQRVDRILPQTFNPQQTWPPASLRFGLKRSAAARLLSKGHRVGRTPLS